MNEITLNELVGTEISNVNDTSATQIIHCSIHNSNSFDAWQDEFEKQHDAIMKSEILYLKNALLY